MLSMQPRCYIYAGVQAIQKVALQYSPYNSSFCLFSNRDIIIAPVLPGCRPNQGHNYAGEISL